MLIIAHVRKNKTRAASESGSIAQEKAYMVIRGLVLSQAIRAAHASPFSKAQNPHR